MKIRQTMTAGFAVVALAALAACSSGGSGGTSAAAGGAATPGKVDGTGKTISVLVSANALYPKEQTAWFSDVAAAFKQQTGATVKFETYATANDELTKIQTSVVSGQGPDIYGLGTTFTPTAYATGAFVNLGPAEWAKLGGRDKFVPASLGISGPDKDHEIGIPFASGPNVMAVNTELLAKAGIDKPATTWDELAAQAKKLTGNGVYGLSVAYADSFEPWKFIWMMAQQAGNPTIDGKTAKLNDPTMLKAYQTYLGWLTTDKVVDPQAVGWKSAQAVAAFASGKAAYLALSSPYSKVTLDASPVAGKYTYAVLPTIPPGATSTPAGGLPVTSILAGDNWVVAKYSKNQDLAFALINTLTNADAQKTYLKTFGAFPTNAEAAKSLASDPVFGPIVASGNGAHGTPFTGAWSDTQLALVNVVVQSIPAMSAGEVSTSALQSALDAAQAKVQASLDKAK